MSELLLLIMIYMSPLYADIIHPLDGSELSYIHVLFRWEAENNTTSYQFELSNSEDFISVLNSYTVPDTTYLLKEYIDWQSTYYWRIKPVDGDWSIANSFTTKQPSYMFSNKILNTEILTYNSKVALKGITLYGVMSPLYSAAIDMDGKEVWNSGGVDSYMFLNINSEFELTGSFIPSGSREYGTEFTFENGLQNQWHEPITENINFTQHDIIKFPNGNYMGLVPVDSMHIVPYHGSYENQSPFPWEFLFPGIEFGLPFMWMGQKIVEWDQDGTEVWSWNAFDHYSLDDFIYITESYWNEAKDSQKPYAWTHFNALAYNTTDSTIYVSSKNLSRITKIDRKSGDIIWNMGIPWLSTDPIIIPDSIFSGQHSIQLLENGNLVIFDNGVLSDDLNTQLERSYSRALEIRITESNGEYFAETVWSFTLPVELYGPISGNVQKLENENYLITTVGDSDGAHSLEVTQSGEIVWDCKYNIGTPQGAIYRAMRIPGIYESEWNTTDALKIYVPELPQSFQVKSIYPNPFNPIITIEYELSAPSSIQFEIYNIKGQKIDKINEGYKTLGIYSTIWNGEKYPSGIYFISLRNGSTLLTKKMILLK